MADWIDELRALCREVRDAAPPPPSVSGLLLQGLFCVRDGGVDLTAVVYSASGDGEIFSPDQDGTHAADMLLIRI